MCSNLNRVGWSLWFACVGVFPDCDISRCTWRCRVMRGSCVVLVLRHVRVLLLLVLCSPGASHNITEGGVEHDCIEGSRMGSEMVVSKCPIKAEVIGESPR